MKSFVVSIILTTLLSSSLYSQGRWDRQANSPTGRWLKKCMFVDEMNGWASGDSGVIIHTSNGGNSWVLQNTMIDDPIDDIYFINPLFGWGVSNSYYHSGTTILQTTNGGVNWSKSLYPDTTQVIFAVYYLDALNGYMGGFDGLILKTTNGGVNWKKSQVDTGMFAHYIIRNFNFYNSQKGFACGGIFDSKGVMWRTTDFGNNWSSQGVAPEPLYDIEMLDSERLIISGGDYDFGAATVKTSNAGVNWNYDSLLMFGLGNSLAFRTKKEAWIALAFSTRWAYSSDTGNTWSEISGPDSAGIWGVWFVDSLTGWAVGSYGAIYKYVPAPIGIIPLSRNVPNDFSISQNYPNPFNPTTRFRIQIARQSFVKVTMYDVLGRIAATLVNEQLKSGSYEITWDAEGYPSGVYFYNLEAGSFSQTHKMVLLK